MGTKRKEAVLEPTKEAEAQFMQPIIDGLNGNRGARTKLLELRTSRKADQPQ